MNVKFRTRAQAKRLVSWAALMKAVAASKAPYWFENSDSAWHLALYLDKPFTTRGESPRTYWAERIRTGETSFGYFVFVFDGEDVHRITDWNEPHQFAEHAVRSAMVLAGV